MLDFRYHALSLAAVLCALAVGVLVGIAIGDSSLVSSAQDGLVHSLRSEVKGSQRNLELVGQQLSEEQTLNTSFWPLAVHELLAGRTVGLVFLGDPSNEIDSLVQDGVKEAAGEVKSVVAVREPPDTAALAGALSGLGYGEAASQPRLLRRLTIHLGEELVAGGRLLERAHAKLLSSYDGQLGRVEAVVIARSEPTMSGAASKLAAQLDSGLIAGLKAKGVPIVGVELSETEPSQVSWYQSQGLSSVDDLQNVGGRAAMAFALAGYKGTFGTKSTANAQLPSTTDAPGLHP